MSACCPPGTRRPGRTPGGAARGDLIFWAKLDQSQAQVQEHRASASCGDRPPAQAERAAEQILAYRYDRRADADAAKDFMTDGYAQSYQDTVDDLLAAPASQVRAGSPAVKESGVARVAPGEVRAALRQPDEQDHPRADADRSEQGRPDPGRARRTVARGRDHRVVTRVYAVTGTRSAGHAAGSFDRGLRPRESVRLVTSATWTVGSTAVGPWGKLLLCCPALTPDPVLGDLGMRFGMSPRAFGRTTLGRLAQRQ